jgi:hypothetical protein
MPPPISEHQIQVRDDRLKLTSETMRAFVKMIHADQTLKAKVIAALDSKGFAAVMEDFFAPSERQRTLLEGHRNAPREMQQIAKDAIRSALATGGTVDVVHTYSQIERASLGIAVVAGPARIHINVNIEC